MDDPATPPVPPEAPEPLDQPDPDPRRIAVGALDEDARYRTRRRAGTRDWLLIHTVAGGGRLIGRGGIEVLTEPGDGVLLAPGTPHDYGTTPGRPRWSLLYAHVHPRPDWLPLLDWPDAGGGIGRISLAGEIEARARTAWTQATRAAGTGVGRTDLFAVNAVETALLWYDTQNPRATQLDERVLRVLEHIDRHLAEPLDLDTLAAVAHLSGSRLSHLFTEQWGTSPLRHVEAQRMARAERLLELTGRPIAEVARLVGYPDPLHFSTRFRRRHGCGPRAYRERARAAPG